MHKNRNRQKFRKVLKNHSNEIRTNGIRIRGEPSVLSYVVILLLTLNLETHQVHEF